VDFKLVLCVGPPGMLLPKTHVPTAIRDFMTLNH
jgi:hypothetical protein